jgi:hypothetical protein
MPPGHGSAGTDGQVSANADNVEAIRAKLTPGLTEWRTLLGQQPVAQSRQMSRKVLNWPATATVTSLRQQWRCPRRQRDVWEALEGSVPVSPTVQRRNITGILGTRWERIRSD